VIEKGIATALLLGLGWIINWGFRRESSEKATHVTVGFLMGIGWALVLAAI